MGYTGVDPRDIDTMMGTFTKSFGAAGGYIGGSSEVISHLRNHSHGNTYANSMPPAVASQTLAALKEIDTTVRGKNRLKQLAENTAYFRKELKSRGFLVYG